MLTMARIWQTLRGPLVRHLSVVATIVLLGSPAPVSAASLIVEEQELLGETIFFIFVDGALIDGDGERFAEAVADIELGSVVLDGRGGDLYTALDIGQIIHANRFVTLVDDDAVCTGACALAWLAGEARFMVFDDQVGFQTPAARDDASQPSILLNSLVGAYGAYLGLPTEAVAYLMTAPVGSVRWLTFADAARYGIDVMPAGE